MLTSLTIENFRAFKKLEMEDLGRVNLIVGENGSGKTCVLEAVELLEFEGRFPALFQVARRRGEFIPLTDKEDSLRLTPLHLFHGHAIQLGQRFEIRGENQDTDSFSCEVVPAPVGREGFVMVVTEEQTDDFILGLRVEWKMRGGIVIPVRESGAMARNMVDVSDWEKPTQLRQVRFIPPESLDRTSLRDLYDRIALTEAEERILDAVRIINPDVDRLAFLSLSSSPGAAPTGGIYAKLNNFEVRVPFGTIGEGARRLLAISLALINCGDGIVLIDEIDTGLHYSVMEKMWKMVIETARRLDAQVFATTHSLDCIRALGWLCENEAGYQEDVRVHRLEKPDGRATTFAGNELPIVIENRIEVR
ncbi:MAG: DNA replication and repair protein RecF [bacterium]|nr:DNA replication and repair protein RecF [bacterium]